MLELRTYHNSYLGADKAHSDSDCPTARDAQHPESGVLDKYHIFYKGCKLIQSLKDVFSKKGRNKTAKSDGSKKDDSERI